MNAWVREKTVKDYIYDLARKELCHDYETEVKRIIEMLDEWEAEIYEIYEEEIKYLRREIGLKDVVIRCLAKAVIKGESDHES